MKQYNDYVDALHKQFDAASRVERLRRHKMALREDVIANENELAEAEKELKSAQTVADTRHTVWRETLYKTYKDSIA